MIVTKQLTTKLSLRKSLCYTGISHNKWYYSKSPRNIPLNKTVSDTVQNIGNTRPTYGTRRMAAAATRELGFAVNRKQIRRIFHKLGWIEPKKTKKQIMASKKKLAKPTAPNQLWQTDMTYVWCGIDGWCYCFNVIDAFPAEFVEFLMHLFTIYCKSQLSCCSSCHSSCPISGSGISNILDSIRYCFV